MGLRGDGFLMKHVIELTEEEKDRFVKLQTASGLCDKIAAQLRPQTPKGYEPPEKEESIPASARVIRWSSAISSVLRFSCATAKRAGVDGICAIAPAMAHVFLR